MFLDILWGLNFAVDLLLLIATNRLSGYPTALGRNVLAAVLGGFYGCVCVLPGFFFLAETGWRIIFLGLMGWVAFGLNKDTLRRCVLYIFLSMALGGIAIGIGQSSLFRIILSAIIVCMMCIFGLRGRLGDRFLPVVIKHNGKSHRFTAMVDTGNTLCDPITGQQVIVVSSHIGHRLLEKEGIEFSDPVSAIESIQGGRLIPFHTVGNERGLLAAKRFHDVTVGKWHGDCLIAFSPQELGRGEAYEALTGGIS